MRCWERPFVVVVVVVINGGALLHNLVQTMIFGIVNIVVVVVVVPVCKLLRPFSGCCCCRRCKEEFVEAGDRLKIPFLFLQPRVTSGRPSKDWSRQEKRTEMEKRFFFH